MRARFVGDPAERSGVLPPTVPAGDWFDVPAGEESQYRKNSHYEVDEGAAPARRTRAAKPVETPAPGSDDPSE